MLRSCQAIFVSLVLLVVLLESWLVEGGTVISRVVSCPCHINVLREIDPSRASDHEAFDVVVDTLMGEQIESSLSRRNVVLSDSVHSDAFRHHFAPMTIEQKGLFRISVAHHEVSRTDVATTPSYDLAYVSTRQATCPILIPFDLPDSRSSTIARQEVDESKSAGPISWEIGNALNRQLTNGSVTPNIVGGLIAGSKLRRYLLSLVTVVPCRDGSFGCSTACSATLIHPEWIISAAHCTIIPNRTRVYVNTPRAGSGGYATLRRVWKHPRYNIDDFDTSTHDLAIGKLNLDVVQACKRNKAVCGGAVPKVMKINTVKTSPEDGMYLRIIGFGRTFFGETGSDGRLRQVDAPVTDFDKCAELYRTKLRTSTTLNKKFQVCAGYLMPGCDACQGDSGGPLVAYLMKNPVLVSVTSFGVSCGFLPGVSVRVSGHIPWLDGIGVPYNGNTETFRPIGPRCDNGEFIASRPGAVGVCKKCPNSKFSLAPSRKCTRCRNNLLRDTNNGSKCSCRRRVGFGIRGSGSSTRCVRCTGGKTSPFGKNFCS